MKRHQAITWKLLIFLSLLGMTAFLVLILSLFITFYSSDRKEYEINTHNELMHSDSLFTIKLTKRQVNNLISAYLVGDNHESYRVKLGEKVTVESQVYFFDRKVPIQVTFDPKVTNDGNLMLQTESFLIGFIPIPGEIGLQAVSNELVLPEWIMIMADEEIVHVIIPEIDFGKNLFLKLHVVDMEKDEIELGVYVE